MKNSEEIFKKSEEISCNIRTNADKIRSMSDEELAEFITGLNNHCLAGIGLCDCSKETVPCSEVCAEKTKKWLQAKAS